MRGFVCYLERGAAGAAIRRVRIVGPEVDHAWTAPEDNGGPVPAGGEPVAGAALASLRAAARWVADELEGVRELLAVCVDTDGGLCSWLSAPSADPSVVAAAVRQAPGVGMGGEDGGAGGEGMGAGVLAGAAFGSDRSVQALAAAGPASRSTSLLTLARKPSAQQAPVKRQRLAVLSVPDAPVRIFLDELDRLKIEVGSVLSMWHAAASAWAPGERRHGAPGANGHERFAASMSPVTGVVLIDPLGRLVWAWSSEGELVAAGSMRLRTAAPVPLTPLDGPAPLPPLGEQGSELALSDTGVRRVPQDAAAEKPALECGSSEVGRLVVDWLAWSAQLGQSPERIVCVGPATVPGEGAQTGGMAPASLAEAVTLAWPGATVDLVVHDDPVGATLNRLRGGPGSPAAAGRGNARDAGTELPADPRVELVELSRRPGRVDRRLYLWGALAILAAGAATAVLGWRINRGAGEAQDQANEVLGKRAEVLKEVEGFPGIAPGIANRPDPLGELLGRLTQMREQRSKLQPERPLVQEVVRVLEAMQSLKGIQISEISLSSMIGSVKLTVPKDDGLTGPTLLDNLEPTNPANAQALRKLSVPVVMLWRGEFRAIHQDRRDYTLTSSSWVPVAQPSGGKP